MKVAIIVSDLATRGGTQKQVLRLVQDLRRRGVSAQILTFSYSEDKGYDEWRKLGVQAFTRSHKQSWLGRVYGDFKTALRLTQNIDDDTDILSVHDIGCETVLLAARLRYPRMKIVWQINDLHPAFRVGPFRNLAPKWTHPLHRLVNRCAARAAHAVTVNVGKNQQRVKECMGVGARLFFPGVDQVEADCKERDFETPISLLSTGVFFPYRNYEVILRAMACLREKSIETSLTLVGATKFHETYADQIRQLAHRLLLQVRITGELDEVAIRQVLSSSDVFLFMNVDQSWGLAVFEAMSASIPTVVSCSAGAAELLAGRSGIQLVDPMLPQEVADAIAEITRNQAHYRKMRRGAFATVSKMTWSGMYCRETWNLFQELVSRTNAISCAVRDAATSHEISS